MDTSKLLSAIRVEDSDSDVYVYIGYIRICAIHEECGRWYPEIQGREMLTLTGFASKQEALDAVVRHLTD